MFPVLSWDPLISIRDLIWKFLLQVQVALYCLPTFPSLILRETCCGSFHWAQTLIIFYHRLFSGTVDFDPGPNDHSVSSFNNSFDTYLLKLDPGGNFIQMTAIGGGPSFESGYAVTKDMNGDLVVVGNFGGTVDFDPGPGETILSTTSTADGFVAKYTEHGEFIWAKQFAGGGLTNVRGVGTDSERDIYVSGPFDSRVDFDPGIDSAYIQAAGGTDGYMVKLNASGEFIWVRQVGSAEDDWVHAIDVNDVGDVYAAGHFSLLIDFDPGPDEHMLTADSTDGYVLKLNTNGEFNWVAQIGGESTQQVRGIRLDLYGGVYATGGYEGTVDFDPGPNHYHLTSTGDNGKTDAFALKLESSGSFEWAYTLGGNGNDFGREVTVDVEDHIVLTGSFEETAAFNPGDEPILDSLQSVGAADIYLARWSQCFTTYNSIFPISCGPYTSPSGIHVWTESGLYQDTLLNEAGCDSVVTVNLYVVNLNLNIVQEGNQIVSQHDGDNYQWVDCDNLFEPVPGATFQTYEPPVSGQYAVIVEEEGCVDTSACFQYIISAVNEKWLKNAVKIYPNPSGGVFNIEWNENIRELQFSVYDALGRTMFTSGVLKEVRFSEYFDFVPGLYWIEIRQKESQLYSKWIVE